ncbi:MAG: DUF2779 domain-containing protein [Acidimicrobiia bacterium]|nr:DUF2779 domain-containing protein [Acidimicrobiia bacterium]
MAAFTHLSKSRFASGLQCHRRLWWEVHEPEAPELVPDAAAQAVLDQGTRVGELARDYVPGGYLIDLPYNAFEERLAATRDLLARGVPAIYEGSFRADGAYAAADILERHGASYRLIEVKSTTKVKEEHLPDVAFQLHLLRRCGVPVDGAELMHLNRECAYPHLEDLFVREDVTGEAEAWQAELPAEIAAQTAMLAGGLPDVAPGPQCTRPYACPFYGRCSRVLPPHHVSTLYRVRSFGIEWIARGLETIDRLPSHELSPPQARQQRAVHTGRPVVEPGLGRALQAFREPLAFLDFETVAPAIPMWDGCHPYDAVPAQFSLHYLAADGSVSHRQFLADGPADPRPEVARRLVAACGVPGMIVAYNASFERRVIEALAESVPEQSAKLLAIAARLADLLPLVRDHVYHPGFEGSFSLKRVLPALVPEHGYDKLEVAEGSAASALLERLLFRSGAMAPEEEAAARAALLRYCALDTMSLIRLLQRLRHLAAAA